MLIINGFVNCKQLLQKVSPNQKHFVTANIMFKYCKGWPEKSKYTTLSAYNMWELRRCGKFKLIFLVRFLI